jgi:3-methylfumaryl-CoA hydratase
MSYDDWLGKSEDRNDLMAPEQLQRFEAMMNRDPSLITEGSELAVCSHWAYFTPALPGSQLAVNGNALNDSLLPPDRFNHRWTVPLHDPLPRPTA